MKLQLRRKKDGSNPPTEVAATSDPAAGPGAATVGVVPESASSAGVPPEIKRPGSGEPGPAGVNLLPPEIRLRAATSRAQIQGGLAIVVALLLLMAAFAWSTAGKTSAEVELGEAQRKLAVVESERNQYRDVPGVYAAIAAARAEIATAMSEEVLFSTLLANLARIVPAPATLTSVKYTVSGSDPKSKAKPTPAPGQQVTYGTAGFSGRTTSMPSVAAVLDAIAAAPEYTNVQLDGAQRGGEKGAEMVEFTISARLTDKALSRRFQDDQGATPKAPSPAPTGTTPAGTR